MASIYRKDHHAVDVSSRKYVFAQGCFERRTGERKINRTFKAPEIGVEKEPDSPHPREGEAAKR